MNSVSTEEVFIAWKHQQALILDVRTEHEFKHGHIPGAVWIPVDEVETRQAEIPRNRTVLVICRSGYRSTLAIERLEPYGFRNLYNVTGGMLLWNGPTTREWHHKQKYFTVLCKKIGCC